MNKCDGIKILELDPKRNLEGSEYMVVAEKDQNYKAPINQIVDLVINDDRIKDYIDATTVEILIPVLTSLTLLVSLVKQQDGIGVRLKIELNRFYTGEAITLNLEQSV